MTREELIEYLADLEHERWSNWQAYVHNLCIKNDDGSLTIPKKYVDHWNWEIALRYKSLPNNIKESDRKEVYKIMPLFDRMFNENKILQRKLNQKNKVIKEAIDYIKGAYEMAIYTKTVGLEEDNIQDLLEILERTDK